jgi:hypothetical protein
MIAKLDAHLKAKAHQAPAIRLLVILAIAVTIGFAWIQTNHVIAPPELRALDWFWKVFVCHCPI